MKVTTQRSVSINLELTEEEATILCALVGGIGGAVVSGPETPARAFIENLFEVLNAQLPDRKSAFSDFFTGNVAVKP